METLQRDKIEAEIREKQKMINYDTKEFTISHFVSKYKKNEIYIPPYQNLLIWDIQSQSKFIESVLLGLPISNILVAAMGNDKLEIIDGSNRLQTLAFFTDNIFKLTNLKVLKNANDCYFDDLPVYTQRKFLNTALRIILLSEHSNNEMRRMLFERLNTKNSLFSKMEYRLNTNLGEFTSFIVEYSQNPVFDEVIPFLKKQSKNNIENLILKFFAYSDNYLKFKGNTNKFLDNYLKHKNENGFDKKIYKERLNNTIKFTQKYIINDLNYTNYEKSFKIPFYALLVSVDLALQQNPNLKLTTLNSDELKQVIKSTSLSKGIIRIIKLIRDSLLNNQ